MSSVTTAKTVSQKKAKGEDTRTALLAQALQAFADKGYEAMSVRELTRNLNVSHNIVNHHFGSKRKLWRAAIEYGLEDSSNEMLSMLDERGDNADADAEAIIADVMERSIKFFRQFPEIPRIIAIESVKPSERLDYLFERFVEPTATVLSEFILRHRDPALPKLDGRILIIFILGGVPGLFTQSGIAEKLGGLNFESEFVTEQYAEAVGRLLTRGVLN